MMHTYTVCIRPSFVHRRKHLSNPFPSHSFAHASNTKCKSGICSIQSVPCLLLKGGSPNLAFNIKGI